MREQIFALPLQVCFSISRHVNNGKRSENGGLDTINPDE